MSPAELRQVAAAHFESIAGHLDALGRAWGDLPGDTLSGATYPFDMDVFEQAARVHEAADLLRGPGQSDDFRAFAEQNTDTMEELRHRPDLVEQVEHHAEHHAGGLFVLIKPLAGPGNRYVKVHDTWGDEGPIVLHVYDADNEVQPFGPTEYVANFDSGVQAVLAFLDLPEREVAQ